MKIFGKLTTFLNLYSVFPQRFVKVLTVGLSCVFLVFIAFLIGYQTTAFTGFPKGEDSFGHLSLIKIIKENFPNVLWNPYWNNGTLLLHRSYPPLYHFLLAFLAVITSLPIPKLVQLVLAFSICLTGLFIFLLIFLLTGKARYGVFSSLFFLASSTLWYHILIGGFYPRIFATMFLSLTLVFLVLYFMREKGKREWSYWLVIFFFALTLLTHQLIVIQAIFSFLALLFFWPGDTLEKKERAKAILLPVVGLTAFYYLPLLIFRPGKVEMFVGPSLGEYKPLEFLSLFKQSYPGLPFLSLPLSLFILTLMILFYYKIKGKNEKIFAFFLSFAVLAIGNLFYILGALRYTIYGLKPDQLLLPMAFYLSLFLGLGLYFLESLGVISLRLILVSILAVLALALNQTPHLQKIVLDQSVYYPGLGFAGIDERRLFRFAHQYDLLGGVFNYYSEGLQTRGYYEQGVLWPEFYLWFEEAVFKRADNIKETKFLLDWFGVKNVYLYSRPKVKSTGKLNLRQKFTDQEFVFVSDQEVEHKKATPVILATDTPVFLSKKSGRKYFDFLVDLAKRGIDSRSLIIIKSGQFGPSDFTAPVVDRLEEAEERKEVSYEGQKAKFVNNQKREIELRRRFSGVILKESYHQNWRAFLSSAQGDKIPLKIYFAGPAMMYVSLPQTYGLPARVFFEYKLGWPEKTGLALSLITLLVLILGKRRIRNS